MSSPEPPRQELASTYVVQDRSNQTEMERLYVQDEMLTTAMGGVLVEQENPAGDESQLNSTIGGY